MRALSCLTEAQVSGAEPFECGPICADDIRVKGFGGGNEPRVVLPKSRWRPALQECAAPSVCQM